MLKVVRVLFRILNRFWMVPIFRFGLGSLQVNPFTGYMMVLKTVGHKTGKTRYVPVNYVVDGGQVYFLSGLGTKAHWYKNLKAEPMTEALLPGRTIHGKVSEVKTAAERLRLIRMILKAGGFAGFFEGYNPFSIPDKQLAAKTREMVLFRLAPDGIGTGASDPGGWGWIHVFVLCILLTIGVVALLVAVL